jgi:hypothetical protein
MNGLFAWMGYGHQASCATQGALFERTDHAPSREMKVVGCRTRLDISYPGLPNSALTHSGL